MGTRQKALHSQVSCMWSHHCCLQDQQAFKCDHYVMFMHSSPSVKSPIS
jgi:hypothetical protein